MSAFEATGQPGQAGKVGALARVTGLTVRARHGDEQIGLLFPSGRSSSGHRLYDTADVARPARPCRLTRPPYCSREDQAVMHPLQLGPLASQHIAERHDAAARRRAARCVAAGPRIPVRRRAGWVLIHLGLRLAVSSADA